MRVWRPAPVFLGRPHARKSLSSRNSLANFQFIERLRGQMSVEREKLLAVAGFVPQDHQRPVILRRSVIRKNVNYSVERRAQRRARLNKKIHTQMNRSALLYGILQ